MAPKKEKTEKKTKTTKGTKATPAAVAPTPKKAKVKAPKAMSPANAKSLSEAVLKTPTKAPAPAAQEETIQQAIVRVQAQLEDAGTKFQSAIDQGKPSATIGACRARVSALQNELNALVSGPKIIASTAAAIESGDDKIVRAVDLTAFAVGEDVGAGKSRGKTKTPTPSAAQVAKAEKAAKAPAKPKGEVGGIGGFCLCGCGTQVKGNFAQGHDAKLHSLLGKVKKGEMPKNQLPELVQRRIAAKDVRYTKYL